MNLSKTELKLLQQIARGNRNIKTIAKAIKKSQKQIYITIRTLKEKQIISKNLKPKEALHIAILLQLLAEKDLTNILADSGIEILKAVLKPSNIKEIKAKTNLKKSIIYRKIQQARKQSIIKKTYEINEKIWPKLKEFLIETEKYEQTTDKRIPKSSVIYCKKENKIVFSCKEELNADKTAFSAYKKYKIKLLLTTNYYSLPRRKLSKKDIFLHSLYVAKEEKTIRNLTFIALFYLKHKIDIKHQILSKIKKVLKGEEIKGYPKLDEIKEKAEVYDIRI